MAPTKTNQQPKENHFINTLRYINNKANNTIAHHSLCFYIKIELIHKQTKLKTQNPSTKTLEQRPSNNKSRLTTVE